MATIKPVWTEGVSIRSAATLAAAATAGYDLDLDTLGADAYEVQINITIGSSSGVTVEVFGSANSGTVDDDVPIVAYTTGTTEIRTLRLAGAHRRLLLTNDDGSNATGNISILGAWRQWDST